MFALEDQKPRWIELLPARGDNPPVEVRFPALPSAFALKKAQKASWSARARLAPGDPDALWIGGDAFSRAMIRHSILDWRGICNAGGDPVSPTHDTPVLGDDDKPTFDEDGQPIVELGTISAFLAEPRLFEAADERFVIPWCHRDAEKNGLSPSPAGISAGATQAAGTASKSVTRPRKAGAKRAHTPRTIRKPRPAKASGA